MSSITSHSPRENTGSSDNPLNRRLFLGVGAIGLATFLGIVNKEKKKIASLFGYSATPKTADVQTALQDAGFDYKAVVSTDTAPDGCVVYLEIGDPLSVSEAEIKQIKRAMTALGITSVTLLLDDKNQGLELSALHAWQQSLVVNVGLQQDRYDDGKRLLTEDEGFLRDRREEFFRDAVKKYHEPMAHFARKNRVKETTDQIMYNEKPDGFMRSMAIRMKNADPTESVGSLSSKYELIVGPGSKLSGLTDAVKKNANVHLSRIAESDQR